MKLNRLLIGFGAIAAAGIAAAGILSHKAKVREAAALSDGDLFFVRINENWMKDSPRFEAAFARYNSTPIYATLTSVPDVARMYKCKIPSGAGGSVTIFRCNPNGTEHDPSSQWNYSAQISYGQNDYISLNNGWDNVSCVFDTIQSAFGNHNVYVQGSFSNWGAVAANKLTFNPENLQYEFIGFSAAAAGDEFKIVADGAWYGANKAGTNDTSLFTAIGASAGDVNLTCTKTTSYDIYYKPEAYNFWIEENAQIAAENYATKFLNTFTCTGTSPGAVTAASTVWDSEGGTIASDFEGLSIGAKGKITTATASRTGNVIERCLDRYRFVIEKYGTAVYKDFMDLYPDGYDPAGRILSPNKNAGGTSGLVLGILGGISVVSAGVLLILRKRKIA